MEDPAKIMAELFLAVASSDKIFGRITGGLRTRVTSTILPYQSWGWRAPSLPPRGGVFGPTHLGGSAALTTRPEVVNPGGCAPHTTHFGRCEPHPLPLMRWCITFLPPGKWSPLGHPTPSTPEVVNPYLIHSGSGTFHRTRMKQAVHLRGDGGGHHLLGGEALALSPSIYIMA